MYVRFEVAHELLWPMALLAGFLGGAQVMDGRGHGAGKFIAERGIDLIHAGEFGTHVPSSAFADMALRAGHASMRRMLVAD